MKRRTGMTLIALSVLLFPAAAFVSGIPKGALLLQTAAQTAVKIAPGVLSDTADGGTTSVVILLADQADVSAAYGMKDQDARGWYVYTTLTQHAERTQAGLRGFLEARGVGYQSYWAANMLIATADRRLVESLAARPDVARVDSNRPARWIEDPPVASLRNAPDTPDAAEWGVQNVNAPAVWAMGFTGQGMVIAGQDTGIRWTHQAIKNHYRGWNGSSADHNYNWHDSIHSGGGVCGPNTLAPCDDHGHGTHTIGTTSGDDGLGNQIGVAPGAKWMGCRNMDQGNGTPDTYTECFQFMIAPTDLNGLNPNPALRPHVVNNSWGCPVSEGCTTRAELETIVENTQASGIFVAVSAGNSGSGCSTVSDPAAIYRASFSVGATDISNTLASFSSRGPSTYYMPNLLKPEISAPGVNVRSCYRTSDTAYSNLSGTSMAGPHVAGVVALLWSARPLLARDIAATRTILQNTANPAVTVNPAQTCGGTPSSQIPNDSFGYGRVNALDAVNSVPNTTPTPTGTKTPTTPTSTPTPTPTETGTPTATSTSTATSTPTTPSATPTSTPTDTRTPTTPSPTPTPTATSTPRTPSSTPTPTPTATRTPTNTKTVTPTRTPTKTPTITRTSTPTRTATPTRTPTRTKTPANTRTDTPTSTPTRTATPTTTPPTGTPTPKPVVVPPLTDFRDVRRPPDINPGPDLGGTGQTAMNFTGSAGVSGDTWITVYDATPADDTIKSLFGNVSLTADVLIHSFNNRKAAGLLALFNEETDKKGLALVVYDSGGSDSLSLGVVNKATGQFTVLATVALGANIVENMWYRLTMDVVVTGANVTVTGKVFRHTTPTDPNSAPGTQIGGTLSFSGARPAGVDAIGEIGMAGAASSAAVDSSVTNFTIDP